MKITYKHRIIQILDMKMKKKLENMAVKTIKWMVMSMTDV